jgi:hypothetical protein
MPKTTLDNKPKSSFQLKTMSMEVLRDCAQTLYDIKNANHDLKMLNADIEKRRTALTDTEQKLIDHRLKMDKHNIKLVKEFNQEGHNYVENVKKLDSDIYAYNNQVKNNNQKNNVYNTNCSNRGFNPSDLDRLPQNLKHVMENNSEVIEVPVIIENTPASGNDNKTDNDLTIDLPVSNKIRK